MKYQIMISTEMEEVSNQIVEYLEAIEDTDLKFKANAFDPEANKIDEAGDQIVFYNSTSHGKIRYFVGPPTPETMKVQFSYKKVEAAMLSEKSAEAVVFMLTKIGYNDLQVGKAAASLTVVPFKTNGDDNDSDDSEK